MVPTGNLETKMSKGVHGEGQMPSVRGGGEQIPFVVEKP
jgi:hypothetical protein